MLGVELNSNLLTSTEQLSVILILGGPCLTLRQGQFYFKKKIVFLNEGKWKVLLYFKHHEEMHTLDANKGEKKGVKS